jgi:hypothetical protein
MHDLCVFRGNAFSHVERCEALPTSDRADEPQQAVPEAKTDIAADDGRPMRGAALLDQLPVRQQRPGITCA